MFLSVAVPRRHTVPPMDSSYLGPPGLHQFRNIHLPSIDMQSPTNKHFTRLASHLAPRAPDNRKRPTDEHSHRRGASDCVSSSRGVMRRAHRYQRRGPLPRQPRPTRRSYPWRRGCRYEPARETVPHSRRGWLRWECQHPEPEWWAGQPRDSQPGSKEPEWRAGQPRDSQPGSKEPEWRAGQPRDSQPGSREPEWWAAEWAGRSTGSGGSADRRAWRGHNRRRSSYRPSGHRDTARQSGSGHCRRHPA